MRKITFLFLMIITGVKSYSQENPLILNVTVLPPYSTHLADYFSAGNQVVITITNPTNQSYNIFLGGSLTNLATNENATIPHDHVPGVPPLIINPGLRVLTGNDLLPYVNQGAVNVLGITEQQIINGNIPEGNYQLCLQAYDYQTLALRSQAEPLGCSSPFAIQFVQPPYLISPQCDQELPYMPVQNIVFAWAPPPTILNPAMVNYEFRLVEIPQGMNAIQAMFSTTIPVIQQTTMFNTFLYSALMPPLIPGRQYAWRVKVQDLSGSTLFSNNGESEICEFRYGLPIPIGSGIQTEVIYPAPGSTIPFKRVPVIAKYDPINAEYRSLNTRTTIGAGEAVLDVISNLKNWPEGPDAAMQQQLGFVPTLVHIQNTSIGRNNTDLLGSPMMTSGQVYTVQSDMTFGMQSGEERTALASNNFRHGFNKPVAKQPILDTVYLNTNRILFSFKTSDTTAALPGQQGLIPSREIIHACIANQPALFNAEVKERYRIEVARDVEFDSIVSASSGTFNYQKQINLSTNVVQLKDDIYKSISTEIYVPDTGQYYWRVHWLTNYNDSASAPYETSDIQRFKIRPLLAAADTIQGACVASCNTPIVTNKNPSTLITSQEMVSVGQFTMKVKSISYFGPMASGKGEIAVPFMNTTVKVAFADVLINEQRQLYQGTVTAEFDAEQFIPNIPGLGKLTVTNWNELKDYLSEGRYSSVFDPTIPMGLPLGLDKEIEGEKFIIAIVGMSFNANRASLAAALSFPMPFLPPNASDGSERQLGLGASDICFHPNGLAGTGVGNLYLAEPLELDYTSSQQIHLKASTIDPATGAVTNAGTYLSWDCAGFRLLHLEGHISFSEDQFIKINTDGNPISGEDVHARFSFDVRRSGNWLASLDFDSFQINGMKDWNFVVQEATLDFSDMSNPENMLFPTNYSGERSILWNGFHLKRLHVGLPKEFKMRSQERQREKKQEASIPEIEDISSLKIDDSELNNRIVFNLNDLLIDKMGVSGKLEAFRLLELANGAMGQWSFSIDTLKAEVICNSLSYAGFSGVIKTPLTSGNFNYSSIISQTANQNSLQYAFNVAPKDTMTVPIWKATMNIKPTSHIKILINQSGLQPEMLLNGEITINGEIGEIPIQFAQVRFEDLKLTNNVPYLTCNKFTFSSPQKWMAGFPVSVEKIELTSQTEEAFFHWDNSGEGAYTALKFTLKVNFMDIAAINTFSGSTTLGILGRLDTGSLTQMTAGNFDEIEFPTLKICGIDLESVAINADIGIVKIEGSANFYKEDPDYGKGFVGGIKATFIKTIEVSVVGCFGEIGGMRYWYLDAQAMFMSGIPMGQIPMSIYGFGGGAFYKMAIDTTSLPNANAMTNKSPEGVITPGTTLSPIRLVPDSNKLFGLMATIIIGNTGGGQVFNGNVRLAVVVTNTGGIGQISIAGEGYFMTPIDDRTNAKVKATVNLTYDFAPSTLNGNFTVMINVPGVLTGSNANNIAGQGLIHASPSKWQLLIGKPSNKIGIKILNLATLEGYLMAGHDLPPIGPLPTNVAELSDELPGRNNAALAGGSGIAFGASFKLDNIDEKHLCFYAYLDAEAGFDLSMLNVGDATCDGLDIDGPIGIDGWYAQGRVWGHFAGGFGIEFDWFGDTKKFEVLEIDAACLLQGGFPNPGWFQGNFHANYSFMAGAISGDMDFKLTIGEKCQPPTNSPVAGIKIISDLSPAQGAENVECNSYPNAVFNVDLDREYVLPQHNPDGSTINRRFRFVVDSFILKRGDSTLDATRSITNDGVQCILKPHSMFTGNKTHTVTITVRAEEKINGNWVQAMTNTNVAIKESMTRSFKSGPLPDKLKDEYLTYCSPLKHQRFYPYNQYENGVINLKQNIQGIFDGTPPSCHQRSYYAIIETTTGSNKQEKVVTYNNASMRASFNIPTLQPNTIHRIRIVHRDVRISGCVAGNSLAAGATVMANQPDPNVEIASYQNYATSFTSLAQGQMLLRNRQLEQTSVLAPNEHLIYEYYFKTSMYGTIQEKIASLSPVGMVRNFYNQDELFDLMLSGPEKLEAYDIIGFSYSDGVSSKKYKTFTITDTYASSWHNSYLNPDIYDLYSGIKNNGYSSMTLYRPDPNQSIPPINIVTGSYAQPLTENETNPTSASQVTNNQPTSNNPFGGQIINTNLFGNTNNTETIKLDFETSYWARFDHHRIRNIVASMKSSSYGPNLNGVNTTVKTKANAIMTTPYKYVYNNNSYSIRFVASPMPGCTSKAPVPVSTKTFAYGTPTNNGSFQFGGTGGK